MGSVVVIQLPTLTAKKMSLYLILQWYLETTKVLPTIGYVGTTDAKLMNAAIAFLCCIIQSPTMTIHGICSLYYIHKEEEILK